MGQTISGNCGSAPNGNGVVLPIQGARILLVGTNQNGQLSLIAASDASGNYSFTGVPNGNYTLTADMAYVPLGQNPASPGIGYTYRANKSVQINGADVTNVNFNPTALNASNINSPTF